MKIGFTGTRNGMSRSQEKQLSRLLYWLGGASMRDAKPFEFHHGGAEGADREAGMNAYLGEYACTVHVHPCPGVVRERLDDGAIWHEVFPPLVRNGRIVEECDVLIAAPETNEEQVRSGTWATIRYARKAGKPVIMLSRGTQ